MRLFVGLIAVAAATAPAAAQLEPIAPECAPLVGTFLTTKSPDADSESGQPGRMLLSLTNGGHAFMSDAAQGGNLEYQPFSTARGAWACSADESGTLSFTATMVDFTYPTGEKPEAKVVRVDITGTMTPEPMAFGGKAGVYFFDLAENPLGDQEPQSSLEYTFTGQKIEAK